MIIDFASESNDISSILSTFLVVFTSKNILLTLCLILFVLILYIYLLFRGSKLILNWYGAHEIERNERSLLYSILDGLSKKAGIVTPQLFSFKSGIPKIFTVGSKREPIIAISTAMLEMFDGVELEVLLSHEIGHIKNNDVGPNTVTALFAGLLMSFPDFVMSCSLLIGFGCPKDPAPIFLKFIATSLVAPPSAILVHFINPTKREFAADKYSIELTGNPLILAKTIENLENYIPLQPVESKFNPGHFHLFCTHTQQIRGNMSIFISMFDTHPGIEARVENILKYSNCTLQYSSNNKCSRVPGFFDLRNWKLAITASFISYLSILIVILLIITILLKDLNILIIGIVTGLYIGAVFLLLGTVAKMSRGNSIVK